jgi:hypothetical protein
MRTRYSHFLPLSQAKLDALWDTATLTVDANVLLDLYRYHADTRDKILRAFEEFNGRLWLSHQAGQEFFRNRLTVIATADKDLDDAEAQLKQLSSPIDKLRGYRLVPKEVVATLGRGIKREVEAARAALKQSRDAHPNYLDDDSVLESVLALFDGAVGPEPSDAELLALRAEGERRQAQKIPPGYLDQRKDGEKTLGDYFLWAQVLAYAAKEGRPVILVTSERKDDWWEKHRGRRMPRRELIEEAAMVAKQRILLYETDHFLSTSEGRKGRSLAPRVAAEIRAIGMARMDPSLPSLSDAEDQVHRALESLASTLVDSDERITSLMAETNASGYSADEIEVLEVGAFDFSEAKFPFCARMRFAGEQDEDRMFCGDTIVAGISGSLSYTGAEWEITEYEIQATVEDCSEQEPDN